MNSIKNRIKMMGMLAIATSVILTSCKDDDATDDMMDTSKTTSTLNLNFTGLEDLGDNAAYEGWLIVDNKAISTGVFEINSNGMMSQSAFEINKEDLAASTSFVLTIEPKPDTDPSPSKVHVLAGDFSGTDASLTIDHSSALNNDFSSAKGKYILATPTDDDMDNEASGIWFLDNSSGSPETGLELPTLPAGWAYEGWAVIDGTPISTGTFTKVDEMDDMAPYSGTKGGPPFPGEDFLNNAPGMLTFPTDLKGGKAVISIEPVPDNSPMPFALKPLVSDIGIMSMNHTVYDLGQNLVFPTGTAKR